MVQLSGGPVIALFLVGLGLASLLFAAAFYLVTAGLSKLKGVWK